MKIKAGALITDASGKIGGHQIGRNNGTLILSTKPTKTLQSSQKQQKQRAITKSIMQAWSQLTDEQRLKWEQQTPFYKESALFIDIKEFTPFILFQKLNQGFVGINMPIVSEPGPVHKTEQVKPFLFAMVPQGLVIFTATYDADATILLYATKSLPANISNVEKYYRKIAVLTNVEMADFNNKIDYYTSVFGTPRVNERVYVKAYVISNISGYKNPLPYYNSTIVLDVPIVNLFESGTAASPPPNEANSIGNLSGSALTITSTASDSYDSLYSLILQSNNTAGYLKFEFPVEAGETYVFSMAMKYGTQGNTARVYLMANEFGATNEAVIETLSNSWAVYEFTRTCINSGTAELRWYSAFNGAVGDNIFLDQIEIYKE